MRILMVGDVVGRPGRRAIKDHLSAFRGEHAVDLVIANAENVAGGRGLTSATAEELLDAGVDVLTSGNHVWDQREVFPYLDTGRPVVRPWNFPLGAPGSGLVVVGEVAVGNISGRVFMDCIDCPFAGADEMLHQLEGGPTIVIVDFHAETTSEKWAMACHLDGRVSAVFGTHTHVPTADARVLPGGTAFVTDVGMVGPYHSIIGVKAGPVLEHFKTGLPARYEVADGPVVFNAVLVEVDVKTGRAESIVRIDKLIERT